jgi:hypothetical protein
MDPTWHVGGGYLVPGDTELRDHHWLAIGMELFLFDPTAAQFAASGALSLDHYIVSDGRTFEAWRRARLGK